MHETREGPVFLNRIMEDPDGKIVYPGDLHYTMSSVVNGKKYGSGKTSVFFKIIKHTGSNGMGSVPRTVLLFQCIRTKTGIGISLTSSSTLCAAGNRFMNHAE